jgi:general secretion pathway protein K
VATRPTRLHRFPKAKRRWESPFPSRFRPGSNSNHAGFALVAVIWSLGLITLLGTAVIVGARYRIRVTSSIASVTAAAAAAESAINLAITLALSATPGQNVKFPLRCRLPGGERVTVTVEEETGKVDLNTATPAVLARLFTALTRDQSIGTRIAQRILEFRDPGKGQAKDTDPRSTNNKSDDARKARFTTIMQLDQIDGISPQLFRMALRFVTVRSGRTEPEADAASPALRELLNLEQKPAGPTRGLPANASVTIRADVRAPNDARFIREALISLGSENDRPFLIREWRHGDVDSRELAFTTQPRGDTEAPEKSCFRIGEAIGS